MSRHKLIAAGALALGAAYLYRDSLGGAIQQAGDGIEEAGAIVVNRVKAIGYDYGKVPTEYRYAIEIAELQNGLPAQLLARLLYQESRYRADIISGATASPAGALGIAQFMPATAKEWGVNPLDPYSSINGAARYLAWLYKRTGTWEKALAAYNWGIGNVLRRGTENAPTETRNYFSQILSDIGLA